MLKLTTCLHGLIFGENVNIIEHKGGENNESDYGFNRKKHFSMGRLYS
jgi:hypothetical protein